MANLRPILFMGLLLIAYMMWVEWQKDYGPQPAPPQSAETTGQALDATIPGVAEIPADVPAAGGDVPQPDKATVPAMEPAEQQAEMSGDSGLITVTTDVLEAQIDLLGGTVVSARLLDYPVELEVADIKVELLRRSGPDMFIAQSGLLSHTSAPNHTSHYQADASEYTLSPTADEIRVPLTWEDGNGIAVTKSFIFRRGAYDILVRHTLSNQSGATWAGSRYDQLQQSVGNDRDTGGFTNPGRYSFFGIGFYSPEEKFEKIKFEDVASEAYQRNFSDGWL
ncbi:MAG: membrane protein insertase YidC, partial [Lysobacterales bacterium]